MKKRQLRTWFYASVAAAFVVSIGIYQLDTHKLYTKLQHQLAASGIQLQADKLNLSFMYTGSIRLDNVHIQSAAFEVDAQRLFIDLNLAALLTGNALPQAIYLQSADINIRQEQQSDWLVFLHSEDLKLKRIHIIHSEIHSEKHHLTLEDVALDIRNIGKNKNPRMELQAHIGEGRIDAHGYLSLKRGEIYKGFGRIKLFDIPLAKWEHGTHLETLNGSITTHINKDASWQSFGHLTLQKERKDVLEVRAKILGDQDNYMAIQNFVLNHKAIGAIRVSGGCALQEQCAFDIQSKNITLQPLFDLLQTQDTADGNIEDIAIKASLNNGRWTSYTQASWQGFKYTKNHKTTSPTRIQVLPTTIHISDFDWSNGETWSIHKVTLNSPKKVEIEIDKITYRESQLSLPITLRNTTYWLPITQWLWAEEEVAGQGIINGTVHIGVQQNELVNAEVSLDASDSEIKTLSFVKPQNVAFNLAGTLLWEEDKLPTLAEVSLTLDESTFNLKQEHKHWHFTDIDVDFDQLKEVGIQLPEFWQPWHGYIRGDTTLHIPDSNIEITQANIDLIQFGKNKHYVDGQIITDGTLWNVENLHWVFGKNNAEFFGGKNNRFDIVAESFDEQALAMLLALPFKPHGTFNTKALRLPFGTLSDVSANYQSLDDSLTLKTFKSKFYEGTLNAKQVDVFPQGQSVAMQGTIQVGGIHLNNWRWLHKQFDTHLQATVYATLNLYGEFDQNQKLSAWKGDGDVSIYNGLWLFDNKNIKADKLNITLRKRSEFNATFNIQDGRKEGAGSLRIDAQNQVSGQLQWLDKTYHFSKTWPNFRFREHESSKTIINTP